MLDQDNVGTKRWLAQLVDPSLGAQRMPSPVPVESCLYSEKSIISVIIGNSGEFAYIFQPMNDGMQLLSSSRNTAAGAYGTTTPNARYAEGTANYTHNAQTNFTGPIGYTESYRITGASVKVAYIGRADAAAGVIRTCSGISKYSGTETEATASQIVDGMTSKVVQIPGVSYNTWYPHDISAFEFKQGSEQSSVESTNLYGMGYGFTPNTAVEIEVCVNFEYVPTLVHQELLGSNARYGPVASNGMLGTITKGLKSTVGKLSVDNKSGILSNLFNMVGGYLTGSSMLPLKAMIL